ncbi:MULTISPECIES: hypothetical protein [Agrobacterium]|uniref:Uncharacterized protein n=1 Tax=Agrobacterium tumefaciens TaxID=358 RepID=A0AAE6BD71_AGRTU|nr:MULTISPECIES: hypothetical protein [Agrobacterium]QCL73955.1 hypothetical protein CFBP5499_11395 [Agrobacterium tumefaciens]QCL79531.1 hypothetical protein CFBP5877_10925 [Agrobacterium tumefaciens]CUX34438.1 conserved exported hypothetical protein [Agrobacterium sp. NCPPB 925]
MRHSSILLRNFIIILLFLPGCTAAGLREFELYRQAYEAQYVEADLLLADLAKAERNSWQRSHAADRDFNPDHAAYYIEGAEPPLTASLRRSLIALKDYNAALVALATGENAETLVTRFTGFAANVDSAYESITAIKKRSAPEEVLAVADKIWPGVRAAEAVGNSLLAAAGREEFRVRLSTNNKKMQEFLSALRSATPAMYKLLAAGQRRYSRDGGGNQEDDELQKKNRRLLAGWVLLIDQSSVALARAAQAAETPNTISISNLNGAAIELRILAERIRLERAR